jgi:glycosyltransferase involved in cell wall biosynthesis
VSRPLKVLRIIARLNVGGPARHVVLLDQGLRARGYHTLLVHGAVGAGEASLEHLARSGGLHVLMLAELGPRLSFFSDARAFAKLVTLTFRETPDVIHTHTAKAGALGRLSAALYNATRPRRRRALVVHTFHGHVLNGYFGAVGNALVRMTERALATLTDCIITISPLQRVDIVSRFRVARESRVTMIPLGLDLQALLTATAEPSRLRDDLGIPSGHIVFGFVGRFVPIKDLVTLVHAFASVVAVVPNARLLMVGDGPMRAEIETAAERAGIATRLHFSGWIEDLVSVYGAMDVCVLPSLNEGTPVALIEAMASGKPVVATAVGGVPDVIDDGRTGLLVPARNASALATAMIALAEDGGRRTQMGQSGRCDVANRFTHVRLVDDIDRLYSDRLPRRRGTLRPSR